jgi:hypothetical protein
MSFNRVVAMPGASAFTQLTDAVTRLGITLCPVMAGGLWINMTADVIEAAQ